MSVQEYLDKMKNIQKHFIAFIECEADVEENYQNLINLLEDYKISQNKERTVSILLFINRISENHYRHTDFYYKIGQIVRILLSSQTNKKHTLSNTELFDIFKHNKRILLLLIEEKIIIMDKSIALEILNYPYSYANYPQYFYPEIKPFIPDKDSQKIQNEINIPKDPNFLKVFKKNQRIGENDSYLCEIIRKDLIEQFVPYARDTNLSFYSEINHSIFETNIFLELHTPSLLDYAAFFGSIRIFRYLFSNMNSDPSFKRSCWLYAIHCPNEEVIGLLESNHINAPPPDFDSQNKNTNSKYYEFVDPNDIVVKEAIKCHHNEVAYYILNSFVNQKTNNLNIENNFDKNIYAYAFQYFNFEFFPTDQNYKFILYYACKFNYSDLVELLIKGKNVNLNIPLILKLICFSNRIQINNIF